MNRIVLIGNGFDLANDYKTSYKDFIVWYFKEKLYDLFCYYKPCSKDVLCTLKVLNNTYDDLSRKEIEGWDANRLFDFLKGMRGKSNYEVTYSPFLSKIIKSVETKGWVDIESDYYDLLCKDISIGDDDSIKKLNECLDFVKDKLIEYLEEVVNEQKEIHQEIKDKIFGPFKSNDIAVKAKGAWSEFLKRRLESLDEDFIKLYSSYNKDFGYLESDKRDYKEMLEDYLENGKPYDNGYRNISYPDNIMLLNFNYTDIADRYLQKKDSHFPLIYIHGKLDDPESVIFGYGDELDEKYREIQEKNKNEYLTNIKSIKYLESDNYRRVLSFVESDCYQVYVMGHSCGNSDRTLLNTLFEHKNCVSIKPFYYVNDTGKDNYLEIVQNISRNFTDMKLMRDRVVNKQFCEQLRKK